MAERGLFVDFMYAVTVGTALPRLDEAALHFNNPILWGVLFMLMVFLEDFYLYHAKVVPNLSGPTRARGFILSMLIIFDWYLSQASFPSNAPLFLVSFAVFYLLKWLGGVFMGASKYPARIDTVFLIPIVAASSLACLESPTVLASHPGRLVIVLAPVWLITVSIWWRYAGP